MATEAEKSALRAALAQSNNIEWAWSVTKPLLKDFPAIISRLNAHVAHLTPYGSVEAAANDDSGDIELRTKVIKDCYIAILRYKASGSGATKLGDGFAWDHALKGEAPKGEVDAAELVADLDSPVTAAPAPTPAPAPAAANDPQALMAQLAQMLAPKAAAPGVDPAQVTAIVDTKLGTVNTSMKKLIDNVANLAKVVESMADGSKQLLGRIETLETAPKVEVPKEEIAKALRVSVVEIIGEVARGGAAPASVVAPAGALEDVDDAKTDGIFVPDPNPDYVFTPQVKRLFKRLEESRAKGGIENTAVVGPHGCFAMGTPILMLDGTTKPVEQIVVGDYVMGPNGASRRVTRLARGREQMYRIVPKKGEPYVVNASHFLSLKSVGAGPERLTEITVSDYLKKSKDFKTRNIGWRTGVEFPEQPLTPNLPPYILGVWLGDGHMNGGFVVSKPDKEIAHAMAVYASAIGCNLNTSESPNECPRYSVVKTKHGAGYSKAVEALKAAGVDNNKHVPHHYKVNTMHNRLELLAGLMDTDGHLHAGTCYDYISKSKQLAEDVVFIARSVGLAAYVKECTKSCQGGFTGTYWRVSISGNTHIIPCRIKRKQASVRKQEKNALVVGFKVEPVGEGDFYGFSLQDTKEHNRLFLLGDFTVVRNCGKTELAIEYAAQHKLPVLVMDCANVREARDWFGYRTIAAGTVKWKCSLFDKAVAQGHTVVVLDELPRVSPTVLNTLFPLLDRRRFTYIEEKGSILRVGPGTIFFATMNEGYAYTGNTSIDAALTDRFSRRIEVDYLKPSDESKVLQSRTGIPKDDADKLVDLALTIRKKAVGVGATLTKTVSTRQLIAAASDFVALGAEGLAYNLTNHYAAEGGETGERAQLLQMVQGKFGKV